MKQRKNSTKSVQAALEAAGLQCSIVELPDSARTAKQAAQAIGCTVAQIAKSIVFRASDTGRAVLVVASGVNRINEVLIAAHFGESIKIAATDFVRNVTGYAIGGVPPCGHIGELQVYLDRDLLELSPLWAAAGTPNAVFSLTPEQLIQLTAGTVIDVI
ncbi:MAG TPA: YbaK/EbsC family protein [Gammaproteobacteria bacterium]|nr:YbaK/EbsC family protein [Gammaproteobacteria bacterium]